MIERSTTLINQIDNLLPQTQCGLCGHAGGCLPYAQSIAQGEAANLCVPGGQPVADALADVLGRQRLAAAESVWALADDGRPQRVKALIREAECIGCTKCLAACPVDAIVGSAKLMHTVIADDCTGCELCVAPCPVDCIDLVLDDSPPPTAYQRELEQNRLRQRYQAHLIREQVREQQRLDAKPKTRASIIPTSMISDPHTPTLSLNDPTSTVLAPVHTQNAQRTIQAATLRSQLKKLSKQQQLNPADTAIQKKIHHIEQQLSDLMI